MQSLNNKTKLKPFWRDDGLDFRADLGIMKNAIVIRLCKVDFLDQNWFYQISVSSYFAFPDSYYEMKFDNYLDCCELAEKYILQWINSILVQDTDSKSIS